MKSKMKVNQHCWLWSHCDVHVLCDILLFPTLLPSQSFCHIFLFFLHKMLASFTFIKMIFLSCACKCMKLCSGRVKIFIFCLETLSFTKWLQDEKNFFFHILISCAHFSRIKRIFLSSGEECWRTQSPSWNRE